MWKSGGGGGAPHTPMSMKYYFIFSLCKANYLQDARQLSNTERPVLIELFLQGIFTGLNRVKKKVISVQFELGPMADETSCTFVIGGFRQAGLSRLVDARGVFRAGETRARRAAAHLEGYAGAAARAGRSAERRRARRLRNHHLEEASPQLTGQLLTVRHNRYFDCMTTVLINDYVQHDYRSHT